ncbi:Lipoxygenase [Parasponia andersonii]|uniref:Lipoxygenase n=1 Tax=Parasponia andersonii TaxID=3476 RepID=A0A2P5BUJ9_PARAD|nr:Lipoxygenase [Parasponia andersonii]
MAILESISTHSPDEDWTNNDEILKFDKFSARLEEAEEIVNKRNRDISLRVGLGVTGRVIPNSILIYGSYKK